MAGSSDKKIKINYDAQIVYYRLVVLISTLVFLISKIFQGVLFESQTFWEFSLFSIIFLITYNGISKSLLLGLKASSFGWYLDLFGLNGFVQITTQVYSFFWYTYFIIPGYGFYKLFMFCWGRATKMEYKEEQDTEEDKKKKKKEEKKNKVVYKKIK